MDQPHSKIAPAFSVSCPACGAAMTPHHRTQRTLVQRLVPGSARFLCPRCGTKSYYANPVKHARVVPPSKPKAERPLQHSRKSVNASGGQHGPALREPAPTQTPRIQAARERSKAYQQTPSAKPGQASTPVRQHTRRRVTPPAVEPLKREILLLRKGLHHRSSDIQRLKLQNALVAREAKRIRAENKALKRVNGLLQNQLRKQRRRAQQVA